MARQNVLLKQYQLFVLRQEEIIQTLEARPEGLAPEIEDFARKYDASWELTTEIPAWKPTQQQFRNLRDFMNEEENRLPPTI